ncbi:MAG: O-antigen ligase family protein, partial [Pseudomonadota bacterium]
GLSVAPQLSWAALASAIVPLAVFTGTTRIPHEQQLRVAAVIVLVGAGSAVLGLLQVVSGPDSALRLFDITNPTEAVGTFANRNHFAAQMYVTLLFGFVVIWRTTEAASGHGRRETSAILFAGIAVALFLLVFVALAMARSRAGLALSLVAAIGMLLMLRGRKAAESDAPGRRGIWLAIGATFACLLFALLFGLNRISTRFDGDLLADLRVVFTQTSLDATLKALPFGFGPGTFVPVYATVEKTADVFVGYANRAHNDIVEFLLEIGIIGAGVMLAVLAILVLRSRVIWSSSRHLDSACVLQRAAFIGVALLLAHSFVDYPLRTAAMSAVFAFALAVVATATTTSSPDAEALTANDVSLAEETAPMPITAPAAAAPLPVEWPTAQEEVPPQSDPLYRPDERLQDASEARDKTRLWGSDDVAWPEEWRSSSKRTGDKRD